MLLMNAVDDTSENTTPLISVDFISLSQIEDVGSWLHLSTTGNMRKVSRLSNTSTSFRTASNHRGFVPTVLCIKQGYEVVIWVKSLCDCQNPYNEEELDHVTNNYVVSECQAPHQ